MSMEAKKLQAVIEETLMRNFRILLENATRDAGKDTPPVYIETCLVATMLRSCAANLAQGLAVDVRDPTPSDENRHHTVDPIGAKHLPP
jgi:hypothetical protein